MLEYVKQRKWKEKPILPTLFAALYFYFRFQLVHADSVNVKVRHEVTAAAFRDKMGHMRKYCLAFKAEVKQSAAAGSSLGFLRRRDCNRKWGRNVQEMKWDWFISVASDVAFINEAAELTLSLFGLYLKQNCNHVHRIAAVVTVCLLSGGTVTHLEEEWILTFFASSIFLKWELKLREGQNNKML